MRIEQVQVPSVARMVHYVAYGSPGGEFPAGEHRAAIITEVDDEDKWEADDVKPEAWDNKVGLCVLNPTGFHFRQNVPQDQSGKKPGTWHWPEDVMPKFVPTEQ